MILGELVTKAVGIDDWSQADKIKLFVWYLHVYRNKSRVVTADLRTCYDEVHMEKPESLSPFLKSLEDRKPKILIRDSQGYYLERKAREELTIRFGGPRPTAPVSSMLQALPTKVTDSAERSFIEEAITCIRSGCPRAAIVLGWCAAVDRLRRKIESIGFEQFNAASVRLKQQTSGKFKRWNKEFSIQSVGELQAVFDTDMVVLLEGMGMIDDNQAQRLETLFQWRCHSAHPGDAPIGDAHVVAFFTDIVDIILANPKFTV